MKRAQGFETKSGKILPYGVWVSFGDGVSICPMKTRHKIRWDAENKTVTAPFKHGPANDTLMMALYREKTPRGYAYYCFGPEWEKQNPER